MITVAALFVAKGGCYFGLPDVDPWDIERDARLYPGPHPVAAHPPCQLWVNMAGVNFRRYGGPHNRPGNDLGCFVAALEAVRQFGGILEHPAGSFAWPTFRLRRPTGVGVWSSARENRSAYVAEVWQSAYGHPARKRTWLYAVTNGAGLPELNETRAPGTHQVGWFDRIKPPLSKKAASATPVAFRDDVMLAIARSAK